MEVEQRKNNSFIFDQLSMERTKSFVNALQELKNLRPQLYSAAEYCEKSYLHSDQKQVVLDSLKDYSVRALVNTVDHLGTVSYKLTDVIEQQTSEVSTMELKVTRLNQKLLTCRTYIDREGLRQQQLLAIIPRHHKHYTLPNSINKKVHVSPLAQAHPMQIHVQAKPRVYPADSPESTTPFRRLTSETKAPIRGSQETVLRVDFQKASPISTTVTHLIDTEDSVSVNSSGFHSVGTPMQSYGVTHRDTVPDSKPMTPFRSSSDNSRKAIVKSPVRHKSILSALFVKPRTQKLRTGTSS